MTHLIPPHALSWRRPPAPSDIHSAHPGELALRDDEIILKLLANDLGALRARLTPGDPAGDALRQRIQDLAQTRLVRRRARERIRLHLLGWPILLHHAGHGEPLPARLAWSEPRSPLQARLRNLWERTAGAATCAIEPCLSALHADDLLGVSPSQLQVALFAWSSSLGAGGVAPQLAVGSGMQRLAPPYLPAAYVLPAIAVTAADVESPATHLTARVYAEAAMLMAARFASRHASPVVQLLRPEPMFGAIQSAQLAVLDHLRTWTRQHGWACDMAYQQPAGCREATVQAALEHPDAASRCLRWRYESTWRTERATQALIRALGMRVTSRESGAPVLQAYPNSNTALQ